MNASFHAQNRVRLLESIRGSIGVFTAYGELQRSHDTPQSFDQEANFWWLTGIEEAGWKVIIEHGRTTLVKPTRSDMQKLFDGATDDEEMLTQSGANAIIEQKDFESHLRKLAKQHSVVCSVYDKTDYGFFKNPAEKELDESLRRIFVSVQSCDKELNKLRAIKQPEEIIAMRQAINLTIRAYEELKIQLPNLKYEYEVEALFSYLFRRSNAQHGYQPIVASGANACTLHYIKNSAKLKKSSLLLLDIGARIGGYAADISRTYALGVATKRQIEVHRATRQAQQAIINLLGPDLLVESYIQQVDAIMKQALYNLRLIDSVDNDTAYRRYFPHAVSHGLGIDVHDSLGAPRYFEPGMVLTVEPGIYIPEEGIGVRIEDDILITPDGNENLSRKLSTDL